MSDVVKIEISQDLVKPVIEKKIQLALIEALDGKDAFIEQIAAQAIRQKVNFEGKITKDSYYDKHDMIETCLRIAVRDAVLKAVEVYIDQNRNKIEKAVRNTIEKHPSRLVKAIVDAAAKSLKSWNAADIDINFKTEEK